MRGRKKTIADHKRDGTYQPCRHDVQLCEVSVPLKPEGISGEAESLWDDLVEKLKANGTLSQVDSMALHLLCSSYASYCEACAMIDMHGFTFEADTVDGKRTKTVPNPAIGVRQKAWGEVVALCRQFGLTPFSRKSLPQKQPNKPESFLDQFQR